VRLCVRDSATVARDDPVPKLGVRAVTSGEQFA
jgi:hypothetical protein